MTLHKFPEKFGADEACREYLMDKRWPEGFVCPRCESHRGWLLRGRPLVQCARCGYQASVTAGTIFHRSHTPLHKWFLAIYLVAQDKRGISALRLSVLLDVCQETAWLMLHKLRRAMADRDAQHMLDGRIELDDAFFGGEDRAGNVGRGTTQTKTLVAVSVAYRERPGRRRSPYPKFARIVVVPDHKQATINAAVPRVVQPGSLIVTDGARGFARLEQLGYAHEVVPTRHLPAGTEPFPRVHTLISNAKAWIGGTFHGIPDHYKQAYLCEFCFRFCRRGRHDELWEKLVFACLMDRPVTLAQIAA